VSYSRKAGSADAVAGKISGVGGRSITVKADISDSVAKKALFDAVEAELG
jgi:3-oxoacyl-[acyl-carrier protein] reductase